MTPDRVVVALKGAGTLAILALIGVGMFLSCDRRGLCAEYFANNSEWAGKAVFSRVEASIPQESPVGAAVISRVFSVRWSGWLWIEKSGPYRVGVETSSTASLKIGEIGVSTGAELNQHPVSYREVELNRGLHPVEIGFASRGTSAEDLVLEWSRIGDATDEPPTAFLFASNPGFFRLHSRRAVSGIAESHARVLGALMLLAGALLARLTMRRYQSRAATLSQWLDGHRSQVHLIFICGLFLFVFLASLRFTGGLYGFDDTRYMKLAVFTQPVNWLANRYAHVYLLKAFIGAAGGDAFRGSELLWSFVFATTVTGMAVAIRSLGSGLQLPTLAIALTLLFSQPILFMRIGAAYADYTVMMLVTVGVAIYLHGLSSSRDGPTGWHAFAIGFITVVATKSKELGAILLWLLPLLAVDKGRLDMRRFARLLLIWMIGALLAVTLMSLLDGWLLGDPLFGLDSGSMARTGRFNFAKMPQQPRSSVGWMNIIWQGHHRLSRGDMSMGLLGLLSVLGAFTASLRERRIEVRLLYLMPLAYFAALILIHTRASYVHLPRYVFPVVPIACIVGASFFRDLASDRLSWSCLAEPWKLVSVALLTIVVGLILVPLVVGAPGAMELLPLKILDKFSWHAPQDWVNSTLKPVALIGLLAALALFQRHKLARLVLLLSVTALLLAPPFYKTMRNLSTRQAAQRSEHFLYPFRSFSDVLRSEDVRRLKIARSLPHGLKMCGPPKSCARIGGLFIGRPSARMGGPEDEPGYFGLATVSDLEKWSATRPDLASRAFVDPSNQIVLIRPPSD